jgi:nuclear pore complex protein Nup214
MAPTVRFSDYTDASQFPPPPGYARLVASSSKYGLTCYADARGVYAIGTARLAEVAESLTLKRPEEQVCPVGVGRYIACPFAGVGAGWG